MIPEREARGGEASANVGEILAETQAFLSVDRWPRFAARSIYAIELVFLGRGWNRIRLARKKKCCHYVVYERLPFARLSCIVTLTGEAAFTRLAGRGRAWHKPVIFYSQMTIRRYG